MKKKIAPLLIATSVSLLVIAVSITSFSVAWFKDVPKYHDVTITTGDYPLRIHTRIMSRNGDGILNETGVNYNYKSYDNLGNIIKNEATTVSENSGRITISFPDLKKNVLDNLAFLDENTMTIKDEAFFLGFIEFTYYKQYFEAYLDMTPTVINNSSIFKFSINSDEVNKNNVQYIDNSNIKTFMNHDTLQDNVPTKTNLKIVSNSQTINVNGQSKLCYAYASVYGVYIDPTIIIPYIKDNPNALNYLDYSLSLSFLFDFSNGSL